VADPPQWRDDREGAHFGKNLGVDVAIRAIESKREQERVAAAGTPAPRPELGSHFLPGAKASLSLITFTAKLCRNRNKF